MRSNIVATHVEIYQWRKADPALMSIGGALAGSLAKGWDDNVVAAFNGLQF